MMDPQIEHLVTTELMALEKRIEAMQGDKRERNAESIRAILYTVVGAMKSNMVEPLAVLTTAFSKAAAEAINGLDSESILEAEEIG